MPYALVFIRLKLETIRFVRSGFEVIPGFIQQPTLTSQRQHAERGQEQEHQDGQSRLEKKATQVRSKIKTRL
jgi:hypothetical protein